MTTRPQTETGKNDKTTPLHASPLARRDLLRVGAITLAASALPFHATAAEQQEFSGKAKSVIYLWMGGGVTHIDSFDPKPEASEEIRGTLTDIATCVPGIRFCETLPCLAKVADKLAVLRSFSHDSNDHLLSQVYTLSGRKVDNNHLYSEPNIGSLVARLQGPRNGLPGYIAVPGTTRPGPPPYNFFVGGWLGNHYAPYCLGGNPEEPDFTATEKEANPSPLAVEDLVPRDLQLGAELPLTRLLRRMELRRTFDQALRKLERETTLIASDGQRENALRLLAAPEARDAFDLSKVPEHIREAYGRTKIGGRCLMARRLVESGARFVMVDYGYDPTYGNLWDNHAVPGQKQPHISEMCQRGYHLRGMDQAFAALISDLSERGLLDSTLVVFLTEFGRTPKINNLGGRDHWGAAGSLFFAGAGTPGGQVIGATDKQGAAPITRGYSPADVAATIYAKLGIPLRTQVQDIFGRPRLMLDDGEPIAEVTG